MYYSFNVLGVVLFCDKKITDLVALSCAPLYLVPFDLLHWSPGILPPRFLWCLGLVYVMSEMFIILSRNRGDIEK